MEEPIIVVNDVRKSFKIRKREKGIIQTIKKMIKPQYEIKEAVKGLSFTINRGEMVGFAGPNGSGKSTTVKMLSGILHPDSGTIKINGYIPYKQREEYVKNIGVVFGQKSQLAWDLPVCESFDLLKHIYRIPEEQYQYNLNRFKKLLDMNSYFEQPVRQLSLGQRMRADIAAALIHSPQIVFFDEPTIGVDVVGKERIREFLVELNKNDNITMLFTTHDMKDIEKTCNRIMIIDHGLQIYDGSLEDIREEYGSERTLDILLTKKSEIKDFDHVQSEYCIVGGVEKLRLTFDHENINMNQLMKQVLERYPVKDISLVEPDVDTIIRNIYVGRGKS